MNFGRFILKISLHPATWQVAKVDIALFRIVWSVSFLLFAISPLVIKPSQAIANDGVVGFALGGLDFQTESRISMQREDLFISPSRIEVSFEFINTTDQDIALNVGFPIPPYQWGDVAETDYGLPGHGFSVTVDGKEVAYQTLTKAVVEGENKAALLASFGINPESFLGYDGKEYSDEFVKLTEEQKGTLIDNQLIFRDGEPRWSVETLYHWRQNFPARKITRVKHTYCPLPWASAGFETTVKYILQTGRLWSGPIKTFHLTVQSDEIRPPEVAGVGPMEKTGPTRWEFIAKDFTPHSDLIVRWIHRPDYDPHP